MVGVLRGRLPTNQPGKREHAQPSGSWWAGLAGRLMLSESELQCSEYGRIPRPRIIRSAEEQPKPRAR